MELIYFSMRNTLRILTIGKYAYDDLLNYISEICKNLERLEINSIEVTDQGLVPIFRKLSKLKFLDIAHCRLITGIAFYDVEEFACKNLQRFVTCLEGYEHVKVKEKLAQFAP